MLVLNESAVDLSAKEFLAVLRFVWPTLIQVEDCILLKDQYFEDNYKSWRENLGENWLGIEGVINHLHIRDPLPDEHDEATLITIGEFLEKTWRAAAQEQFPSREFNVELTNDEADYGPTLYMTSKHEGPSLKKIQEPRDG